jgi:hypothetical protein
LIVHNIVIFHVIATQKSWCSISAGGALATSPRAFHTITTRHFHFRCSTSGS